MKKCPYCAEQIQDEAILCKHCGRDLRGGVTPPSATPQQKSFLTQPIGGGGCLVICLLLFVGWCVAMGDLRKARTPPVQPAATQPNSPLAAENRQQTDALQKYLKNNFGYPGMETSWYPNITSLSVQGRKVVINTKLNRKSGVAQEAGRGICGAISSYLFSRENRGLGIEHIQVLGTDGGVVVSRRGFSDQCQAR